MASVTITLTNICAGGHHLTFNVTGDRTAIVASSLDNLLDSISEEEVEVFVKLIARMVKLGRTNVQARNVLQAGVTITV